VSPWELAGLLGSFALVACGNSGSEHSGSGGEGTGGLILGAGGHSLGGSGTGATSTNGGGAGTSAGTQGRAASGGTSGNAGAGNAGAGKAGAGPAQPTFVAEVPTVDGPAYLWMGDLWASRPDGIKGHDLQYWSPPLVFDAAGTIAALSRVDNFTLELP
jgi:hypothetical protein